jgi:hypothetical protein
METRQQPFCADACILIEDVREIRGGSSAERNGGSAEGRTGFVLKNV